MAANEDWGFYIDIESLPPKYTDNYTKMKKKYKIKNNFYTDFETIYEDLEYYNEVKYPQTMMYYNYNINIVNSHNKIFCIIYCALAMCLLVIFAFL
jgi:hypothetical protein